MRTEEGSGVDDDDRGMSRGWLERSVVRGGSSCMDRMV